MWIYPEEVLPEGHKAKPGDIVIITRSEFGDYQRQIGLVVEADDFYDDAAVNVMLLPTDDDSWLVCS